MYNIKPYDYIPEPHPVSSDYIIAAHYYAAWKYGAAQIHGGFDDLAKEFPERTPLMGYYDEENPEVTDWEIKWACEHGVNCFIHCWYRKPDNTGKPMTEADLRCGHGLHEALFNARYRNCMKFAIMFEASPRWGGTDPEDMVKNLMPFWCREYFSRENYLKIDNKPVLFVYNQPRLTKDGFPKAEDQKKTFDACRAYAKEQGFDGMIFALEERSLTPEKHADIMARGYDFHFCYCCGYPAKENMPPEEEAVRFQLDKLDRDLSFDPMAHIATASCFWDARPRYKQHWIDMGFRYDLGKYWYVTPDAFRGMLREMRRRTDVLPDGAWGKRIFMIDNWNEWDEGHFVSPSMLFGFRYLQAIREELSNRDNLPDYRMPQDLGFEGYNTSWKTPDFTAFCEEKKKNGEAVFPF